MTRDKINGLLLGAQLSRLKNIDLDTHTIIKLSRMAKRLRSYYTHSTNGYEIEKHNRLADNLEKQMVELAQGIHLHCYFQSDPRGGTLYVSNTPLNPSNYNSDGIYIE